MTEGKRMKGMGTKICWEEKGCEDEMRMKERAYAGIREVLSGFEEGNTIKGG